jgi:hypothetical protein
MQQMVFLPGDEGPFWMMTEQWQSTRLDIEIQGKVMRRNFTKQELMKKLAEQGIVAQGNIMNIKQMGTLKGIPLDEQIKKIQPGWEGKAKGMLQVLWEQGFFDVDNLKQYTVDGRKDAFGNL